jgi:diaminopimelate decarboxylase
MIDDNLCPAHSRRGDFLYIGLAGAYRIDMRSRRNVGIGKDRRR